jgi:hypothetical protein
MAWTTEPEGMAMVRDPLAALKWDRSWILSHPHRHLSIFPAITPAAEGIHSVELANAILLSSLEDCSVELPLSAPRFAKLLARLKKSPTHSKK